MEKLIEYARQIREAKTDEEGAKLLKKFRSEAYGDGYKQGMMDERYPLGMGWDY